MHSHTRIATATWNGNLKNGVGQIETESGALKSLFTFKSRLSKNNESINPEELLGSAISGSFIMQLASMLDRNNTPAENLEVETQVTLQSGMKGPELSKINILVNGVVPTITSEDFKDFVEKTKNKCPISKVISCDPNLQIELKFKK